MSPREKKLLLFLSIPGFIILNMVGYNFAKNKRTEVDRQRMIATQQLKNVDMFRANSDAMLEEMEWLDLNTPEPAANQEVQTELQKFAEREAKNAGLAIKAQKPLPTDATAGRIYHRAKIEMKLTGTEEALYQWFDKVNIPEEFRIASHILLKPNPQDDAKIDCTATIEKWFLPPTP